MTRPTLLLVLATFALPATAAPLKNLCDQFEPLRKLEDLPYVQPVIRVTPETGKPEDIVFTIAAKAGPVRVSPEPDGRIRFPLTEALCRENPDFTSNATGPLDLSVRVDPQVPPATQVEYRQLDSLRQQWDTAVSRQGFFYRMLAPSAKAFRVVFDPAAAATAELRFPQGTRRIVADANGSLVIPFDPAWVRLNPPIVFSALPKHIGLQGKD